jgi:CRISPR-associated protein Cas1
MATLYVLEIGARLEKEYRHLAVYKDDELLQRVPLVQLSEVVLVGSVGATTPALIALLEAGVTLSIIRPTGRLLGRLTPPSFRNIPLRHRQYACATDPDFCLHVSKAIVSGKLRNQRTLMRRLSRARPHVQGDAAGTITSLLKQVKQATDLNSLRGMEGRAARVYFDTLRQALPAGWESRRRSRRPPEDPFNALLGLGYTLLGQSMMTALEVAGLDPYDGFFHADKYGRPALALDLMEEFRSPIVDSLVLLVINKRILKPEDFQKDQEGVFLKPHALRRFLVQYTARLQTEVIHPLIGRRLTYQKCFEVQARLLRKAIEEEGVPYRPFLTK